MRKKKAAQKDNKDTRILIFFMIEYTALVIINLHRKSKKNSERIFESIHKSTEEILSSHTAVERSRATLIFFFTD